jgi:Rrf2 family protein
VGQVKVVRNKFLFRVATVFSLHDNSFSREKERNARGIILVLSCLPSKILIKPIILNGVMSMNLSKSVQYGMIAVGYLAKQTDAPWVQAEKISKEYDIPLDYLMKILNQCVRSRVLQAKRGPLGGFSLAKPAKEISLLEIIEAVDGPIQGYSVIADQAKKPPFAQKMDAIHKKATDQATDILKKAKLSDLVK